MRTCVCHVRNQSLTNVTVYIQVYMQVYLHINIHIYVQVAHNFYTFLRYKVDIWYGIYPDQDLRPQGSECITGHIEHMQNGNRIISLVQLLALES